MRISGWLGLVLGSLPAIAAAQAPPPGMTGTQIRGTVETVRGGTITVVSDTGPVYTIAVPPNARLQEVEPRSLADVKVGSFVGSGAMRDATGRLTAQEVHIFAVAGTGEGQRPMGNNAAHIMTNAAVTSITPTPPGETMTLTFGTRSQPIYLPPNVPVVSFAPAKLSDLAPGTKVRLFASTGAGGGLQAGMVMIADKGATLP